MAESVTNVFRSLSETFEAQDNIREALRTARDVADVAVRAAHRAISSLHNATDLSVETDKIRILLAAAGEPLKAIESSLPQDPGAFQRYADIWHIQLHMACMVAVVVEFVDNQSLVNVDKIKEMLGADVTLPIEDYLMGVCNAVSELSRLCLNRVIVNDFQMPSKCHEFASNVFEGFKQLNLRNDFLRKRYDGMKYDVKRMEDILYDLSIRGLLQRKKRRVSSEVDSDPKKAKPSAVDMETTTKESDADGNGGEEKGEETTA